MVGILVVRMLMMHSDVAVVFFSVITELVYDEVDEDGLCFGLSWWVLLYIQGYLFVQEWMLFSMVAAMYIYVCLNLKRLPQYIFGMFD